MVDGYYIRNYGELQRGSQVYNSHKNVEKYKTRTACAKNKKGTITVYKVLRFRNGKLYSYYQNSPWVKGEVKISSRKRLKNPTELTYGEKKFFMVDRGLHFFTNLKEARSWRESRVNSWENNVIQLWKVEVNTRDIVSYGSFGTYSCLVAHKAKLIKKIK